MAFWQRKGKGVYVYFSKEGKQTPLSRKITRELDTLEDHNIDEWVARWSRANEKTKPQTQFLTHAATIALVDQFCTYLASRGKSPKTVYLHKHNLITYCLPYLVQDQGLISPDLWPTRSVRMLPHLQGLGIGIRTINVCNVSMRVFWKWLLDERIVEGDLRLRNAFVGQQATPLTFTLTPKETLALRPRREDLRLLALLGYFFSLRPQEIVALRPCDFRAGSVAERLEACSVMKQVRQSGRFTRKRLFGRLAVNIQRQRVGKVLVDKALVDRFVEPKAGSRGWVSCFDEKAAREIVRLLQDVDPEELLFPLQLNMYYKAWKKAKMGVTIKDLRRASIYWLGHNTDMTFTALKNHARHADPSTTALYTRRPGQDAPAFDVLDLDA